MGLLSNPLACPTPVRQTVEEPCEIVAEVVRQPAQSHRRLRTAEVDDLRRRYADGETINDLAEEFRIHRTTVMEHLERGGVPRRRPVRSMTDITVRDAAERYAAGDSLLTVAKAFGVSERTIRREFNRAGVSVRPRRGSPKA